MRYIVNIAGREFDVDLDYRSEKYRARLNGKVLEVSLTTLGAGRGLLMVDGASYEIDVRHEGDDNKSVVFMMGMEIAAQVEDYHLALLRKTAGVAVGASADRVLRASMPGLVAEIKVTPGEKVVEGQPLIVVEAMKMENVIKAPAEGVVKEVFAQAGKSVDKGTKLLEFE